MPPLNPAQLTSRVKAKARELGFQLVGVTTPVAPAHIDVYANWIAQGHQAEMGWMATNRARARRADPKLILPECEAILVLGIAYRAPDSLQPTGDGETGGVAAYAWGADYHEVLPERLRTIVTFIEAQVGHAVPNRWYTDTGPILERELAQRAGLGWIGKNTCLINPHMGSYFLLAEILLGIELEPDFPITTDHCGTCTRCITACPTDCILPDRTIDANQCISYLTIEHKGFLPLEFRSNLGEWIFGCDVCQQVCPWNQKFGGQPSDPAFEPRPGIPPENPAAELALTPQEFNRKFKGSPVKRTKRRGYLRNIAVRLGNQPDRTNIPGLIAALQDFEPLIRAHAAWALGQIGGAAARTALQTVLETETDPPVISEIKAALNSRKHS
jgi:epoxyqueuosine reductase